MIQRDKETRQNLLKGAEILYDVVSSTLGPKGRNVLVKDKLGYFSVTHDGVTVAKAVKDDNPSIQLGIDLIKEASKQMDLVGDGTTTVTVLTYHLIKNLYKLIDKGMNPMMIKRELDSTVDELIEFIKTNSTKIHKTYKDVYDVANISVADKELAKMVAELVVGTGYEGAINVETQTINETTAELIEGYLLPNGFASELFVNNPSRQEVILENPAILVVSGKMDSIDTYTELLNTLIESKKREILFICDSIDNDLMSTLIVNKVKGVFNIAVVKNSLGHEYAYDLASTVGATVYEKFSDLPTIDLIGTAKKVVVNEKETIIFGASQGRIKTLQSQFEKNPTDELKARISALSGKVGMIKVGGVTESEADEKKYRIDDAVAATRAAIKGGIVPGAGMTLYNTSMARASYKVSKVEKAIRKSLRAPAEKLLINSGYNPKLLKRLNIDQGIDVTTGDTVSLIKAGIIDPTIVTTEAVRNAFSVAGLAITIGGSIIDKLMTQEEMKSMLESRL